MAATTGALLGFGARERAPALLFSAAGDRLRGLPVLVAPDRVFRLSASLGALHHVVIVLAWSVAFALVARRLRGRRLVVAAAVMSALAGVGDAFLPAPMQHAAGAMILGQRVVYGMVLAVAFIAGIRLAQRESTSL
jgi:hypothetical protein